MNAGLTLLCFSSLWDFCPISHRDLGRSLILLSRYFVIFYPVFLAVLGRIVSEQKADRIKNMPVVFCGFS